ncbi:MAG: hypothetical protein K5912_04470 [Alphaproteobacteria bacterium]|nr:hypothetical protein [Alphaproteobacteria bacterium]
MKKLMILFACIAFCGTGSAFADETAGMTDEQIIATLKQDIAKLDNDILKCEKQRKGWLATTIIGGIGVAATGTAAIVQGSKLSSDKKELSKINNELGGDKNK